MKKLLLIIFLLSSYVAYGQSLSLFDIDASDFPNMKANILAFDNNWQQITNLSKSDFILKEDGIERNITNISCPAPKPPDTLSSVLVIDVSGSMMGGYLGISNMEVAKNAAKTWVDALSAGSECAITSFDNFNYLNQDFTQNKSLLNSAIDQLYPKGGTNYDAALINPQAGGLVISKKGKYKKVIIFLTDGQSSTIPSTAKIINEANSQNCVIYCVTLGMTAPQSVKDIANQTGGAFFENVRTKEEAEAIYMKILQVVQGVYPCTIEWDSEITCKSKKINVELSINNISLSSNSTYLIPNDAIAKLSINPRSVIFENPIPGETNEQKVIVTAENSDFTITDIIRDNPAFDINPKSFMLKKGESIELTISYTAIDSGFAICKFEIENDLCPTYLYASGGWKGIKPSKPTLKLTHPNGGEKFVIGSDTLITWEGVLTSDTVRLEYSIDNGQTWNLITNKASELEYKWTNIPKPTSEQCLIRVSQGDFPDDYDPDNPAPTIIWEKTYGGSRSDYARSILEIGDGNYVVAGSTSSNDGDIKIKNGQQSDYWIVKVNQTNGDIIWEMSYGGGYSDAANSIIEAIDGNIVIAGIVNYYVGNTNSEVKAENNVGIVKVDNIDGSIIWQRIYGGNKADGGYSIFCTSEGNLIVAGYTFSDDGDINSGYKGNKDIWIIKIDHTNGDIIWEKTYGGNSTDEANSIIEIQDGNYIISGYSHSNNGDIKSGNKGMDDYWIIKIAPSNGDIIWEKTLGGSDVDRANSIIETSKGNLVIAGFTFSNDGDVKSENKGTSDFWIIKMNSDNADIIWEKTFGGSSADNSYSVIEVGDGNFVIAGSTSSNNGDVQSGNKGASDCWIIKINSDNADLIWEKTLGGSQNDYFYSVIENGEGNYLIAGSTYSDDGDIKTGNKGLGDLWIAILAEPNYTLQSDISDAVFSIVAPEAITRDIDMKQALVGTLKDSTITNFIHNIGSWDFTVDSIYFEGADANVFSLVSGIPKYTVETNNSHFAEIRFAPTEARIFNALVVIVTQSDTLKINIRGEGIEPRIEIVNPIIDFGLVEIGELKDTIQALTIRNISSSPITITNTKHNIPNITDFSTLSGGGSFTLQPNETHQMNLSFKPSSIGRTSGTLEFHYIGIASPEIIQLFGEAYSAGNPFLAIRVADLSAYAGERNELPIILDSSRYLSIVNVHSIDFDLEYNPTLIAFLEYDENVISDSIAITHFSDIPINEIAGSTLLKIRSVAGLGNAEFCDIKIINVILNGGIADVTTIDGKFNLLGICDEGSTRLINPSDNNFILTISPNPSDRNVEISINLLEKGSKSLKIYDYNGTLIEELDLSNELGYISLNLNTQKYSNGLYFVHLQTPTIIKREKLIINR